MLLRRSEEHLQLLRFVQIRQFTYASHKSVEEELSLLHEHLVLLSHGLLLRDGRHIQAEESRIQCAAELIKFAESSENLEFTDMIPTLHLVHVMRSILDLGLRHGNLRRIIPAKADHILVGVGNAFDLGRLLAAPGLSTG